MPLYAGELNIRRGAPLAEFPAPLSEVLRAQAQETQLHNPLQALRRLNALNAAELGDEIEQGDPFTGTLPVRADVRRADAATARARVQDEGLKLTIPDDGISERALDILMKAKRDEMRRQDVFSRGPQTIGAGAARLGTALIESLFDPLNIASAFIPIVGPARYAAMVARAGSPLARAGVRAQVGALEGAAGAALLEPLIYSAAQAEQLDYTMYDSLANIAFGGLFGGGLHTVGGAVRDVVQPGWWRTADPALRPDSAPALTQSVEPELRQTALRAAVVQAATGRAIDVDPILRMEREAIGSAYDRVRGSPAGVADDPTVRLRPQDIGEVLIERGPGRILEKDGQINVRPGGYGLMKIIWKHGEASNESPAFRVTRDDVLNTANVLRDYEPIVDRVLPDGKRELEWQVERADGQRVVYSVRRFADEDRQQRVVTVFVNRMKDQQFIDKPLSKLKNRLGPESRAEGSMPSAPDTGPQPLVSSASGQGGGSGATVARPAGLTQAQAAAQKNASPDSIRSADPEASRAADVQSQPRTHDVASAEEELAESLTVTQEFAAALGEPDRVGRELAQFDEAIKRAEAYAKALKAGAACGIG